MLHSELQGKINVPYIENDGKISNFRYVNGNRTGNTSHLEVSVVVVSYFYLYFKLWRLSERYNYNNAPFKLQWSSSSNEYFDYDRDEDGDDD